MPPISKGGLGFQEKKKKDPTLPGPDPVIGPPPSMVKPPPSGWPSPITPPPGPAIKPPPEPVIGPPPSKGHGSVDPYPQNFGNGYGIGQGFLDPFGVGKGQNNPMGWDTRRYTRPFGSGTSEWGTGFDLPPNPVGVGKVPPPPNPRDLPGSPSNSFVFEQPKPYQPLDVPKNASVPAEPVKALRTLADMLDAYSNARRLSPRGPANWTFGS